jgi:hypothetical protein
MNIQKQLKAIGFQNESNGGGTEVMVRRGIDGYTWVASALDGDLPEEGDWLICEYRAADWEEGEDCVRSFDSLSDYLSDVIGHIA